MRLCRPDKPVASADLFSSSRHGNRSLDPSHVPGLQRTSDPKTGQAVYDSVGLHGLSTRLAEQDRASHPHASGSTPRRTRRRRDPLDFSDSESDASDDSNAPLRRSRPDQIPVPPIPDLRYEQGVLASIRPFLHRADGAAGARAVVEAGEKSGKVATAEKAALASAALTAEGAAQDEHPSDVLMAGLRIEWSKVSYVILRDQVRFARSSSSLAPCSYAQSSSSRSSSRCCKACCGASQAFT